MVVCSCHGEKAGAGAEAQGCLVRRGEAIRNPVLNCLACLPRRLPPTCGVRTNLWPQLCFPTHSREHAHESGAQERAGMNSGAVGRKERVVVLCMALALGVPAPTLLSALEPDPGIPGMRLAPQTWGNSKGSCSGVGTQVGPGGVGQRQCSPCSETKDF